MPADMPAKHTEPQAAMKLHLSQSTWDGDFDGQHGMSLAIASMVSAADISDDAISDGIISSAVACREVCCEEVSAMTGRAAGANARPAIIRIASNRRMVKFRFTRQNSHKWAAMESSSFLHIMSSASRC